MLSRKAHLLALLLLALGACHRAPAAREPTGEPSLRARMQTAVAILDHVSVAAANAGDDCDEMARAITGQIQAHAREIPIARARPGEQPPPALLSEMRAQARPAIARLDGALALCPAHVGVSAAIRPILAAGPTAVPRDAVY